MEKLENKCLCVTPINKLSEEEILSNGEKIYKFNNKNISSFYLQLYSIPEVNQMNIWLNKLKDKLQKNKLDMIIFIIYEIQNSKTYEYQIMKDCIKEIITNKILSRGKDIMPLIEERCMNDLNSEEKMQIIVNKLINQSKTIATMESCTGGQLSSEITNVTGSSEVLKESYVSYCNEAKIKFGVPKQVIEKYTVYSYETAIEMSKAVKNMANSDLGVGITGQIGRIDPYNLGSENNNVWYSINNNDNILTRRLIILEDFLRFEKKKIVVREIIEDLYEL